jgi:hypothetical protein
MVELAASERTDDAGAEQGDRFGVVARDESGHEFSFGHGG